MEIFEQYYNEEYYQRRLTKSRLILLKNLAKIFVDNFQFDTFIDVGCATGELVHHLIELGKKGFGIDKSRSANNIAFRKGRNYVKEFDATESSLRELFGTFDILFCLELAEHIEPEKSDDLIKTITKLSNSIVFSAAPIGQGGTGHINEHNWEYWKNLFLKNKFSQGFKKTIILREAMDYVNIKNYYFTNIRVISKIF